MFARQPHSVVGEHVQLAHTSLGPNSQILGFSWKSVVPSESPTERKSLSPF